MKVESIEREGYKGLKMLIFLNIFDGIVTYIGLKDGFYVELNKMLNNIFAYSEVLFIVVKIFIPTIVLYLLLINLAPKISKITKLFIYLGNWVYSILCIYHIILITKLIV